MEEAKPPSRPLTASDFTARPSMAFQRLFSPINTHSQQPATTVDVDVGDVLGAEQGLGALLVIYSALGKPNNTERDNSCVADDPFEKNFIEVGLPTDQPTQHTMTSDSNTGRPFTSPFRLILEVALSETMQRHAVGGPATPSRQHTEAGEVALGSVERGAFHAMDDAKPWMAMRRNESQSPQGSPQQEDKVLARVRLRQYAHPGGEQQAIPSNSISIRPTRRPLTQQQAAAKIINWFRGFQYKNELAKRKAIDRARVRALQLRQAALVIQRAWLSYRQLKAFRAQHAAFLTSYLEGPLYKDECAATIQEWYQSIKIDLARREKGRGQRREVIQLRLLPTGAEVAQERAVAASRLVEVLKGRLAYKATIASLREQRRERAKTLEPQSCLQEQSFAASRIQQCFKTHRALVVTHAKRDQREATSLTLRRQEASEILAHFNRLVVAKVQRRKRLEAAAAAEAVARQHEQATVIQSIFRMSLQRGAFLNNKHRREKSALKVQSAVRQYRARHIRKMLIEDKLDADAYARLMELVVGVQAAVRGYLCRTHTRRAFNSNRLSGYMQRIGRAYKERSALRCQVAACILQRAWRFYSQRSEYLSRQMDAESHRQYLHKHYAALAIQRAWAKHQLRLEMKDRVYDKALKHRAAAQIQKAAAPLIARGQLKTLKTKRDQLRYQRMTSQAATLIAATYRGYAQKARYTRIRQIISACADLVAKVSSGYLTRKYLYQGHTDMQRHRAAVAIQHGLRTALVRAQSRAKLATKRQKAIEARARTEGAIIIQRNYRMMKQLRSYEQKRMSRHRHAETITLFAQAALAVLVASAKLLHRRRVKAVFIIQRLWLKNRRRLAQLRSIHEMECALQQLGLTKCLEQEGNERATTVDAERADRVALVEGRAMLAVEILRRHDVREKRWRAAFPMPVQLDAILSVQKVVRGFLGRRQALKLRGLQPSPHAMKPLAMEMRRTASMVKELRAGRKASSASAASSAPQPQGPSLLPSSFLPKTFEMWLRWLQSHPELFSLRSMERLLQREVSARRRTEEMAETSCYSLFGEFNLLLEAHGLPLHAILAAEAATPLPTDAPAAASALATGSSALVPYTGSSQGLVLPPIAQRLMPTSDLRYRANLQQIDVTPSEDRPAAVTTASHFTANTRTALEALAGTLGQLSVNYATAVTDGGEVIDLSNLRLAEDEVRSVLARVKGTGMIRRLYLGGNDVRDAICADVADVMESSSTIEHISLAHTSISDVGASHLALGVARCPSLRTVDLSDTAVTSQLRSHIQSILSHRAQLAVTASRRLVDAEAAAVARRDTPPELRVPQSFLPSRRRAATADEATEMAMGKLAILKEEAAHRRAAKERTSKVYPVEHVAKHIPPTNEADEWLM